MYRSLPVLLAALAVAMHPDPTQAQIKLGAEAAYIAGGYSELTAEVEDRDLSGTFGIGGRVALSLPTSPIGAYGGFTYYFPDCDLADCSYWTASIAATLGIPIPLVSPYVVGGWQFKSYDLSLEGFESSTENNPFVGLGVQFGVGVNVFLEGVFEFEGGLDDLPGSTEELSVTPFVLKGGILIGS